jgi:hypothetical protein
MMARPILALGVLLVAGSYAATNDSQTFPQIVPVAQFDWTALYVRDSTWPNGALTAQPEQIFEN